MEGATETLGRKPAAPMQPAVDPAAWRADDEAQFSRGVFPLTDAQIADIDHAVASVEARGLDIQAITRAAFDLGETAALMAEVRRRLLDGLGFAVIKGLPVDRYTRRQAATAFYGLGTHLGRAVSQNAKGHVLGHVKDLADPTAHPSQRRFQTAEELRFHADRCDVVGLLCLHTAKSGGESRIVSAVTIYNEMLARRPDLVAELIRPFYRDRRGEIAEGQGSWFELPVFNFQDGYLSTFAARFYIDSAQRYAEVPRLTERQLEALDMMEALAEELRRDMIFEPGDIQLLNNHVTLHSRTSFEDWPDESRKRHLLRLWLDVEDARPLTPDYAAQINGINVPGMRLTAPLEAE